MSNLEAAKEYMRMFMPVFPLVENGKRPITERGFKDATTEEGMADLWWGKRPEANIGYALPPDTLVLDWDMPDAHSMHLQHPTLGKGPEMQVRTRRGWHWYYAAPTLPEGYRWRAKFTLHCDIKAPGKGYTVLPPSTVADYTYKWLRGNPTYELTPFPGNLLKTVARKAELYEAQVGPLAAAKFFPWEGGTAYGLGALRNQVRAVLEAENGDRNNTLYRATIAIAGFIAGGELAESALQELRAAANNSGLDDPEVYATMQSAWETGRRYPKEKP